MKIFRYCLVGLLACLFAWGCHGKKSPKDAPEQDTALFQDYVSGYTSGLIHRSDPIIIKFVRDMVSEEQVGRKTDAQAAGLKFQPAIAGEACWTSPNTLVFTPRRELDWDTRYEASFNLSQWQKVPAVISELRFSFLTDKKAIRLQEPLLEAVAGGKYRISGRIETSDYMDAESIEPLLSAKRDKKSLGISWNHSSSTCQHLFTIGDIVPDCTSSVVEICLNPEKAGIKGKTVFQVGIPGSESFELISANVSGQEDQVVTLRFSSPVRHGTDMRGLFSLGGNRLKIQTEGSIVRLYPQERMFGEIELWISDNLENTQGEKLGKTIRQSLQFGSVPPAVKMSGKGTIIPEDGTLFIPFEAVALKAVDVRITQVFSNNILQFLQDNDLSEGYDYYLKRVGRIIRRAKVDLDVQGVRNLQEWNTFKLDLGSLIDVEPGALYNIEIGFRKEYAQYADCSPEDEKQMDGILLPIEEEDLHPGYSYDMAYYNLDYDWQKRNNPCSYAYYASWRFARRNVMSSHLGIIAKADLSDKTYVYVTNLLTAKPESGVQVELYDFQNQLVGQGSTDHHGMLSLQCSRTPFLLIARKNEQKGYLKMDNSTALSYSNFDIAGKKQQKGVKGFLYAERSVWRPGDSIYLNFVLEDKLKSLPEGCPIVMEVHNPQGQLIKKIASRKSTRSIYPFWFKTEDDDPTGNWHAVVKIGNLEFGRSLSVETIKPNRLKIDLSLSDSMLHCGMSTPACLQAKWLTGSPAAGAQTDITAVLHPMKTGFTAYPQYDFSLPWTEEYSSEGRPVFNGALDSEGKASFDIQLDHPQENGGMLRVELNTKVAENGGGFSSTLQSCVFSPYRHYVGLSINYDYQPWKKLNSEDTHEIKIITVNEKGEGIDMEDIQVQLFDLDYHWWYQSDRLNLASYAGKTYHKPVLTQTLQSHNGGRASFTLPAQEDRYGSHLLLVHLPDGHTAGQVFYLGQTWGDESIQSDAQMLTLMTDKKSYQTGEEVCLQFPASEQALALVTLENSQGVLQQAFIRPEGSMGQYRFRVTGEMAPNVYACVHLLQPHAQSANDRPIRLYGVTPVLVEDKTTHLQPVMSLPGEVRPRQTFSIKVKEQNRRAMDYSLAIVDEGLLNLTRFRTPDPWDHFYAREALGTKTYDLYKDVAGAFGSRLESLFSVGGSDQVIDQSQNKANRFKAVVKVLGPFRLEAGREAVHEITLPDYLGSVRVMAVAADNGRYGCAQQEVTVREPLMAFSTLPRTLGPDERVSLPVSIFVSDNSLKKVRVSLENNDMMRIIGKKDTTMDIAAPGEYDLDFFLQTGSRTGTAQIRITAVAGKEKSSHLTELEIRQSNTPVFESQFKMLKSGETWQEELSALGIEGSNKASITLSPLPPLNLTRFVKESGDYSHRSAEQCVSSSFPLLYLPLFTETDQEEQSRISLQISESIERLSRFQTSGMGFAYWPGYHAPGPWISAYAANFLLEAEKAGYAVPSAMKNGCLGYLRNLANNYRAQTSYWDNYLQCHRLYILALAGQADITAMNRMRGASYLNNQSKYLLAAAYLLVGMKDSGMQLIDLRNQKTESNMATAEADDLCQESLMLHCLLLTDETESAYSLAVKLSQKISSEEWCSMQGLSMAMSALADFCQKTGAGKQMEYSLILNKAKEQTVLSNRQQSHTLSFDKAKASLILNNRGSSTLFAVINNQGTPAEVDRSDRAKGLTLKILYHDHQGNAINIDRLSQGTDFYALVTVQNAGNEKAGHLVLTQLFPAGWEIVREQTEGNSFDYQDVRDDRIYTYFSLNAGESRTFTVKLNASYCGEFVMSPVSCESLYHRELFYARKGGRKVQVVR